LAKKKKPFTDGELIKEAMITAANSLFGNFKNKNEIINAFNTLHLSERTTTRRVEQIAGGLEEKLFEDINSCEFFFYTTR
jgi:hypothetical protein